MLSRGDPGRADTANLARRPQQPRPFMYGNIDYSPIPHGWWEDGLVRGSSTDLFDGPPWAGAPAQKPLRKSARLPLTVTVIGAATLALTTPTLPWYGFVEPTGLHFGAGWSALSGNLFPLSPMPGGTGWGYLILGLAALTSLTAFAVRAVLKANATPKRPGVRTAALLAVAALATMLLVVTSLEIAARPPYGDGPRLGPDWGAVVGGLLAAAVWLSAGVAAIVERRGSTG